MGEQILLYYLRISSVIFLVIVIYFFYILFFKEISLKKNNFLIKKNQNINYIIYKNIINENKFNLFIYSTFTKVYNNFYKNIHYGNFIYNDKNFYNFLETISKPSNVLNKITIVEGWSKKNLNTLLKNFFNDFDDINYNAILADSYFINSDFDFNIFKNKLLNFKKNFFLNYKNNQLLDQFTIEEIMIIGSLLEKEGIDDLDKKKIFSVIVNRLNKKMRLQIDATVIFAITSGDYSLNRKLNYDDLKVDHPYNTYRINGLPPKPISYVGTKTIEIMMENYKTDYLFYFYDRFKDIHVYSEDYKRHIEKLNEYRKK